MRDEPARTTAHAGRLRVLYVTSGMPFPPHSGGQFREFQQITRLSDVMDIHLRVVAPSVEVDAAGCSTMERYCTSVRLFEPIADLADRCTSRVPERMRQHQSQALRRELSGLLAGDRIDVVHVQGYFLMQHVPTDSRAPLLLFEENLEYLLDQQRQRVAMATKDEPSWTVTRQLEHAAWRRATMCVVPSQEMRRRILTDVPGLWVRVSPNGWDHLLRRVRNQTAANGRRRVTFLGNYAWPPSEDAAVFLLERLWPQIRARVPAAELFLVGATPTARMLQLAARAAGVSVTGALPSVAPMLEATDVFLCPLRVGGGVKMKMVDALSSGCAVVSTSVGAQGLPPAIRDAFVVADTSEGLVEATVALLHNSQARQALAARAAAVANGLPSWDDIADQVGRYWSDIATASGEGALSRGGQVGRRRRPPAAPPTSAGEAAFRLLDPSLDS